MKITLWARHHYNHFKPMVSLKIPHEWIQWDECDLSDYPPMREKGTLNAHGKIPRMNVDDLPKTFRDTDGNEHLVDDIVAIKGNV